jgi:6-phosphogluconolactonase (cycloisomerase 2 family)
MTPAGAGDVALWVGSYTADMDGTGTGIAALRRTAEGYEALGPETAVASPSFLALHPSRPVLYAVSEGAELVHAFRVGDGGELSRLGQTGSASALVCHVAVDPDSSFLVACCWGDGAVLVFELEPDGSLGRRHAAPESGDPYGQDRQSRAHSCLMLGDGRFITAEMGHDLIRFWRFTGDHGLESHGALKLPHGSGPRHFALSSDGRVYANTEYTAEIAVLAPAARAQGLVAETEPWLELVGLFPASATGVQAGDAAAEICLDRSERYLFVGVRGSNRICRLELNADGNPEPSGEFSCGGDWPRHHCIDDGRLVVALQRSDAIAVFSLGADGSPTGPPRLWPAASPTCVLPGR